MIQETTAPAPKSKGLATTAPLPPPRPVQPVLEVDSPPAKGGSGWWIWLLLLIAAAGGGFWWYHHTHNANSGQTANGKPTTNPANRPVPVVAAHARRGDMDIYMTGLGSVTALNTVTVRTRIDGQIDQIYFTEGQLVHRGDLLFQIDPRPYQVQLAQMQAQYVKDKANRDNAKLDLDRDIQAKEAIPTMTLDTARSTFAQLEAALAIDQAQIEAAKLNLTYTRITAPLTGRIGLKVVDQGNMVHANDTSGLAVITQLQPIAVVFNLPEDNIPKILQKIKPRPNFPFEFMLPGLIRKVMNTPTLGVQAYDRDLKNKIANGRLLALDTQIDPTTGTVRLKGVFPNEDESLFPNQFVNARLLVDTLKDVVIVPTAAIQRSPTGNFIYVVKREPHGDAPIAGNSAAVGAPVQQSGASDAGNGKGANGQGGKPPEGTVEMRTVTAGAVEGDETVVESGLNGGGPALVRRILATLNEGRIGWIPLYARIAVPKPAPTEVVVIDGVDKLQNGLKVIPRISDTPGTKQPTTQPDKQSRQGGTGRNGGGQGPRAGTSAAQGTTP